MYVLAPQLPEAARGYMCLGYPSLLVKMNCSNPSVRRAGDPEDCRLIVARDNAVHSYPTTDGELILAAGELEEFLRIEDELITEVVFLWQLLGYPRVHLFQRTSYDWRDPSGRLLKEAPKEQVLECAARLRERGVFQTRIVLHMEEVWHASKRETGLATPVTWSAPSPGPSVATSGERRHYIPHMNLRNCNRNRNDTI
jgi:hypothetical protein